MMGWTRVDPSKNEEKFSDSSRVYKKSNSAGRRVVKPLPYPTFPTGSLPSGFPIFLALPQPWCTRETGEPLDHLEKAMRIPASYPFP
jgi:hypothetical protein